MKRLLLTMLWLAVWLVAAAFLISAIHPLMRGESIGGFSALLRGVLAGRDTLSHDYPAAWWGWSQVRATGALPLWNPSWFCGEAFVASQTFMPFYPPNWLGALLPFPLAFNIQYPLHLVLAAAVMAWGCRRRGLGWVAAGLAGLSWGFGGHLATLAGPGHIQKLQALAWLPLVTYGAWRIGRGDPRRGLLPLALGLALQVTAGHLQILYLTLAVAFLEAFAGYRATATLAHRGSPGYVPVDFRVAVGALALLTALGLSAVFWIPTAEFAALSNREGALSWEDAIRGSLPREEALEFVFPRLLGDSMVFGRGAELAGQPYSNFYLGRYGESSTSSPERVVSDYVGAGVLVFALFALVARRRGRRAAWGYAALAAAAWALSIGGYLPWLYRPALRFVPGLSHFRSPSTMMALLAYGLTMAAALGLEGFLRPRAAALHDRERAHRISGSVLLVLAVAAALLLLHARYVMLAIEKLPTELAASADPRAIQARYLFAAARRVTFQGATLVLLLGGLWSLLAGMPRLLHLRRGAGFVLLALLTAAWGWDLLGNVRPFWNAADARPFEKFLTRHWALPMWESSDEPVVRYLEVGNELSNRALTLSNFNRFLSIGTASGYHPVTYGRFEAMQRKLGFLSPNFLRVFNVRYLVWPADRPGPYPEGFREYARSDAEGRTKLLLVNPDIHYIREVPQLFPVNDFAAALERLARPGFNAYQSTTITKDQLPKNLPEKMQNKVISLPQTHLQARILPLAPGETMIKATMRQQGYLAVSEPAVPGWRLRINGRLARQQPAAFDGFCLGIKLDGGANEVLLFYDPASQRLGLFITLMTLALAAFRLGRRLSAPRPVA